MTRFELVRIPAFLISTFIRLTFHHLYLYFFLPPSRDLSHMSEVTRDYLEGPEATDPTVRRALMNTWGRDDLSEDVDWRQKEPEKEFFMVRGAVQ